MWILNNKHLKNIYYQTQLKNLLGQTNLKPTFEKLTDWWETLKTAIKSLAKTFSKLEAKNKRKEEYKLRKKLKNAQKKIHKNPHMLIICRELKNKLEYFEKYRAVGAAIRAKKKRRLQGEKCNKYFLNLEKNKLGRTVITEITQAPERLKLTPTKSCQNSSAFTKTSTTPRRETFKVKTTSSKTQRSKKSRKTTKEISKNLLNSFK